MNMYHKKKLNKRASDVADKRQCQIARQSGRAPSFLSFLILAASASSAILLGHASCTVLMAAGADATALATSAIVSNLIDSHSHTSFGQWQWEIMDW